ncbi:MAG: histidine kinase dimerization/phospho-acceptor domain-containing protein [Gaiellales bacterium]
MKSITHEELSHGLRTPLTSVLGYTGTLIDRWDELEERERIAFVQVVYGEALRMAHSVEQLDRQLYHEFAVRNARSGAFKGVHGLADAS